MRIAFFEAKHRRYGKLITSSADWYRCASPASQLKKITNWHISQFKDPFINTSYKNWDELISDFDILFCPYSIGPHSYMYLYSLSKKYRKKLVVDFDDNAWELPQSTNFKKSHLGTSYFHIVLQIAQTAPFITTTNISLAKKITYFSKNTNVSVLPNFVDLENIYAYDSEPTIKKNITLVFFGSQSHEGDLNKSSFAQAVIKIVQSNSSISVKTVGVRSHLFKQAIPKQYIFVKGAYGIDKWKKIWKKEVCSSDISLAPLVVSPFTRCKSPIKFFESAAAKLPFVCTDTLPYRGLVKQGKTGFLCKTEQDWYQALSLLIKNEELRKKVGNNAYIEVNKNWTIQKNIVKYKEFFEMIYNLQ